MDDAVAEYRRVEAQMFAARLLTTHNDEDEDRFLDQLDALWQQMTEAEQATENLRSLPS